MTMTMITSKWDGYLLTIKESIINKMRRKKNCVVCKYEWRSKVSSPRECPDCKSRYWKRK